MVYQTGRSGARRSVSGRYRLLPHNRVGFAVGTYDHRRPLTSDPVLESATLLGGSRDERLALAETGRVIVGSTVSPDIPGRPVAFHSGSDIFVYYVPTQSYGGGAPANTQATFTSDDPSRLVISTDPRQDGSASITTQLGSVQVYLQALAPGDVTLRMSVSGLDPVTVPVHISSATLYCSGCPRSTSIGVKQSAVFSLRIGSPQAIQQSFVPNPGSTVRLTMTSSTPGVASVTSSLVDLPKEGTSAGSFRLTGDTPGTTTLSFSAGPGIDVDPSAQAVQLTVRRDSAKMADVEVGKDLAAVGNYSFPSTLTAPVTLTIADPSIALLSTDNRSAGQRQITLPSTFTTARFYVQGLASSGTTRITAESPGFDPITANVVLEPSGFGWSAEDFSPVQYMAMVTPQIFAFALDPATLAPVASQTLRFGLAATPRVSNSDSAVVGVTVADSMNPNDTSLQVSIVAKSPGSAVLSLTQPSGFSTPSIRQSLSVKVQKPSLLLNSASLGKDLQTTVLMQFAQAATGDLTLTSLDPSRLLLSRSATEVGSGSITIPVSQYTNFYLQALGSSGTVKVTASIPGWNDASAVYTLLSTGFGIVPVYGSSPTAQTTLQTTTKSAATQVSVALYAFDPAGGQATLYTNLGSLRPGVDLPAVTITSSNPEVGRIERSPARLNPTNSSPVTVDLVPLASGDTVVSVVQPPGFLPPPNLDKFTVHVSLPSFTSLRFTQAKDTVSARTVSLQGNVQAPSSNLPVTITSTDPARVLLSSSPEGALSASVSAVIVSGRNSTDSFYIHALDNKGIVPLTVSAPGHESAAISVALSDLAFYFQGASVSPTVRAVIQNGAQKYGIAFRPVAVPGYTDPYGYDPPAPIRPKAGPIVVNVVTSDAATLSVDTPQVTFVAGSVSATVTATPVSPGPAVLSLQAPDGYVVDRSGANLPVSVEGGRLSFGDRNLVVGRDLQVSNQLQSEVTIKVGTPLTISSSDSSRLLVSSDRNLAGQASITLPAGVSPVGTVWLQALADNGTVTVNVSAEGYQPGRADVMLTPSAAVFSSVYGPVTVYLNSQLAPYFLTLTTLDPATLKPSSNFGSIPRPGADLAVNVSVSDKSVVSATPATIAFRPDSSQQSVTIRPLALGTSVVTLGPLPGQAPAASGAQMLLTVAEPDLSLPEITIGRDLQAPLQVRLANRLPAPASDLTLSVQAGDFTLAVGNGTTIVRYPAQIQITIPAGQRLSTPFYVIGLTPGTARLSVNGGSYSAASTVTVAGSTFVFKEATPVNLAVGGTATVTVMPALLPLGTPSPQGLAFAAGSTPVTLPLKLDNSALLTATPAATSFQAGDQQALVTLRGVAAGTTNISLSPSTVYQVPNARSTLEVRVSR